MVLSKEHCVSYKWSYPEKVKRTLNHSKVKCEFSASVMERLLLELRSHFFLDSATGNSPLKWLLHFASFQHSL